MWRFFKDFEYQAKLSVWVSENSPPYLSVYVCEWKRTHFPFVLPSIKCRTNLANRISDKQTDRRTDTHKNLKPNRIPITLSDTHYGHTQEDTHYTEWYPLRTHPRGYPFHWVIPIPWVIFPLTKSFHNPPKSLSMTPRDPGFLTNKPDTKWYPLQWGIPWHWIIPITLSSSQ